MQSPTLQSKREQSISYDLKWLLLIVASRKGALKGSSRKYQRDFLPPVKSFVV